MIRIHFQFVALAAVVGLTACKEDATRQPLQLIPDNAGIVGAVDFQGLRTSKIYAENKDTFESKEYKAVQEAAKGCNLDIEKIETVAFGVDANTEDFAVAAKWPGIGAKDNLKCFNEKFAEIADVGAAKVEEKDGKTTVEFGDGKAVGYPAGNDVFVVTSKGWAAAVQELIGGKGKAAVDGSLKEILAKAPRDKHIWFAGKVPPEAVKESPVEAVTQIYGGMDFKQGVAVSIGGITDAPEKAKSIQEELQKGFDQFKAMAAMMQVPQGILDSVKIEAAGNEIKVAANASEKDLATLRDKLAGMMGGSRGGHPPVPAPPAGGSAVGGPSGAPSPAGAVGAPGAGGAPVPSGGGPAGGKGAHNAPSH